jgi:hypothetical protein
MIRFATVLAVLACGPMFAADQAAKELRVVQTQRLDFPSGGVLHVKHSMGIVTVEGWDQPALELTTTKGPQPEYDSKNNEKPAPKAELENVRISAEHRGEEFNITTTVAHPEFLSHLKLKSPTDLQLDYLIRVPRDARLVIDHEAGEVNVIDLTGPIRVTAHRGQITLRLPPEGNFAIDAKSDLGDIVSDFAGHSWRRPWIFAHGFVGEAAPSAHKVYLRTGYGDILVLKIKRPAQSAMPRRD